MSNSFIARQPIYDRNLKVEGYELLFRSGEGNRAEIHDADQATEAVMHNSLIEIGLNQLVGDRKVFVNFTRNLLARGESFSGPPERLIFELPETLEPDAELLAAVKSLRDQGYRFALDNFSFDDRREPYLPLAELVKINIHGREPELVAKEFDRLRGRGLKAVAHRVETRQEYHACRKLGFDYFQGFFFCRPEIVSGRKLSAGRVSTLRLLTALQSQDISLVELEKIIAQDVSLSYRLLRYLNSVQFSLPEKITSIGHAISFLGLDNLRVWASIILLARIDEKPLELMRTSLVRARMCELLGEKLGHPNDKAFFMVGLFSTLEALLDTPLDEVVQSLPLADDAKNALLEQQGQLGAVLRCVLAYERGDWPTVESFPFPNESVREAYLDALRWADGTVGEVAAPENPS